MPIDRDLAQTLFQVRAMLWANAHRRHFGGRQGNLGVSIAQLKPEVVSLRKRVEARISKPPREEAKAIARLLPLPALEYWVIPALAEAVVGGRITTDELQSFLLTSEFDQPRQPEAHSTPDPVPAAA